MNEDWTNALEFGSAGRYVMAMAREYAMVRHRLAPVCFVRQMPYTPFICIS